MLLEQIMIDKYIGVGNIKINNIDPLRRIYVYINFGQVITFTFIGQKKGKKTDIKSVFYLVNL